MERHPGLGYWAKRGRVIVVEDHVVIIKFGSWQALETERSERPLNRLTVNFRVRHTHLRSWRDLTLPNPTRRESSTREPRQTSELVNPVLNLCSIKESLWYSSHLQTGSLWLEIGKFEHFWRKRFIKNKSPVICPDLKYVVCFYINFLMEPKIAVVCSNVPSSQSSVQILECCPLRPGC